MICLGSTTMHQSAAFLLENLARPGHQSGTAFVQDCRSDDVARPRAKPQAYPAPKVDKRSMIHAMLDAAAAEQTGKPVEKLD